MRLDDQLGTIGYVELSEDGREMVPHGFVGDLKAARNCPVAQTLYDRSKDGSLARCKLIQMRQTLRFSLGRYRQKVIDFGDHLGPCRIIIRQVRVSRPKRNQARVRDRLSHHAALLQRYAEASPRMQNECWATNARQQCPNISGIPGAQNFSGVVGRGRDPKQIAKVL